MDKEEKRIAKALGAQEVPEVDEGNLLKYSNISWSKWIRVLFSQEGRTSLGKSTVSLLPETGSNMRDSKKKTHHIKTNIHASAYLKKR
jgi:hypothetical protein